MAKNSESLVDMHRYPSEKGGRLGKIGRALPVKKRNKVDKLVVSSEITMGSQVLTDQLPTTFSPSYTRDIGTRTRQNMPHITSLQRISLEQIALEQRRKAGIDKNPYLRKFTVDQRTGKSLHHSRQKSNVSSLASSDAKHKSMESRYNLDLV